MEPPPPPPSQPSSSSTTTTAPLPRLEILTSSQLSSTSFGPLQKRINSGADVTFFHTSKAYRDVMVWVMQLNHAMIPRSSPDTARPVSYPLTPNRKEWSAPVRKLRELLAKAEGLMAEAPPEENKNRRFGNGSCRVWHGLLGERIGGWVGGLFDDEEIDKRVGEELKGYFMGSWGDKGRLDYGTGHELSFLAFLGGLWKVRYFGTAGEEEREDGEVEREIVTGVVEPYLEVVRKLITTYTLEPAGSHGVWGLDDHSFLPYILGSAQFTRPIPSSLPDSPTPVEGSCPGAPKPASVTNKQTVVDYRGINMYFGAIGFIYDVKKGPFWEHSPMLFDISGIKDGWGKINKGMVKMYRAEVLGKFPVVQHFGFGGLWRWEEDPELAAEGGGASVHVQSQPQQQDQTGGTKAPWAMVGGPSGGQVSMPRPDSGMSTPTGFPGRQTGLSPAPTGFPARGGQVPMPRGGIPNTGPMEQTSFPRGGGMHDRVGGNQFSVTKAPWAKD
ncbi:putative serine/threonine-protein phosphatase 2A activator [Triangularia verruculosa]|uniref:Serine/threonine-protein phosphatase 2A activator n=1 Tax=Triangularia verruculosa TaxID=2587418 RepID=A0AAN7AW20_9PEZI|nr:putative serine/threonine-protein phosphatase 2A activator [Triangularia verruculosa]